jgi:hypothetical protein
MEIRIGENRYGLDATEDALRQKTRYGSLSMNGTEKIIGGEKR